MMGIKKLKVHNMLYCRQHEQIVLLVDSKNMSKAELQISAKRSFHDMHCSSDVVDDGNKEIEGK
jgi:hypothetical protein